MKILITTDLYTTETNGVVTSVRNLTEALIARGHEVKILTLADGIHSYRIGNVYYIRSVSIGAIYPDVRMAAAYRHRLIRQLIEWKPDVIHSQCEFFSFQFAHSISKETGAPIVHTYHTLYEQYVGYVLPLGRVGEKAVGSLSRLRLKEVKAVIAPTRKVERTLRAYGLQVPIRVVPSGIGMDQHRVRLTQEQRVEKRRALGIGPQTKVLVSVGRLGTEKKLDDLLRYFAATVDPKADIRFLIVGGGPAGQQLRKLAESLGLKGRVVFTGMVPPERVQEYYQLGDVFVSASTSETQGLTYVEAAANGLPLLCRKDPCLEDVMVPGENGYDFVDEDQFRQGLEKILEDPQWLQKAGECSERVAARFGKEAFGAAAEDVYRLACLGEEERVS